MTDLSVACATYPGDVARARHIYGEVFRMGFEFIFGNRVPGAIAEFGTYEGFTALMLADLVGEFAADQENYSDQPQRHLYVFDSFCGFPASDNPADKDSYAVADFGSWVEGEDASPPGTEEMLRKELAERLGANQCTIVKGYYESTLTPDLPLSELALVNLDCDLYQSTYVVLDHLMGNSLLPDGALLYFDDFNCNRASPRYGQRRVVADLAVQYPQYDLEHWHNYGWHGRAFVVHRR